MYRMTESTPTVARLATVADRQQMSAVLASAFAADPVFQYMLPLDMSRREQRLQRFFSDELKRSQLVGGAWTATHGDGAAIWYPPGRWKPSTWQMLQSLPAAIQVFGRQLALATQALTVMQKHHPAADHWYLCYLATAPGRQGNGVGSALMRPVLRACDEQGVAAYLEATTERNQDLYLRHGFVPSQPLVLPRGGPQVCPMWRQPV